MNTTKLIEAQTKIADLQAEIINLKAQNNLLHNKIDPLLQYRKELRQKANLEILDRLKSYIEAYPDMRFHQALFNLDIVTQHDNGDFEDATWKDEHHMESSELLKRITTNSFFPQ